MDKLQFKVVLSDFPEVGLNLHFCDWRSSEEGETIFSLGHQGRLPRGGVGTLGVQHV